MKKSALIFLAIVLVVGIIATIRSNAFYINDRITKFWLTHSTVLSKNIMEYDVISIGGDAYNVGIDTKGTISTEDDIIVWTIKK